MMDDLKLRLAKQTDAAALAQLRYDFRASTGIATESEAEFVERCAAWMNAHLDDGGLWKCWVAESENIVGALWLQLVEKIPNPRAEPEYHAYITNFYLRESARGQGTGTRMLTVALDWCRAREVHTVILWPSEKSRTLYERQGFAVRPDLLELVLAGN
ncbi:MAG TPA: GNAT family N-acetyltransferase [Pyrinomonadaceae bacterium]|jgi:GNAT superfamily N-acetyltransferase|nr:GNAT family N-acetyltransferase [Pyrinomonadaceae bacterium]